MAPRADPSIDDEPTMSAYRMQYAIFAAKIAETDKAVGMIG
jgi:hypothetical protein